MKARAAVRRDCKSADVRVGAGVSARPFPCECSSTAFCIRSSGCSLPRGPQSHHSSTPSSKRLRMPASGKANIGIASRPRACFCVPIWLKKPRSVGAAVTGKNGSASCDTAVGKETGAERGKRGGRDKAKRSSGDHTCRAAKRSPPRAWWRTRLRSLALSLAIRWTLLHWERGRGGSRHRPHQVRTVRGLQHDVHFLVRGLGQAEAEAALVAFLAESESGEGPACGPTDGRV